MNKITVIGSGSVGSTISYTLTVMGLASEVVMIDINSEKALGEALDNVRRYQTDKKKIVLLENDLPDNFL